MSPRPVLLFPSLSRVSPLSTRAVSQLASSCALVAVLAIGTGCAPRTATTGTSPDGVSPGAAAFASPMAGKRAESSLGMLSTSHADATDAGLTMLRAGGNAVDAAVAAAFALSVVDPSQTGLGGGGAATVWLAAERRADHLSFYGRAGADAAWAQLDTAPRTPTGAGRGVATPGMVAGLLALHERHGSLPLARVMSPAIALARNGFVVSPLLARTIASASTKVAADSAAAALFMPNGQALRPGDRLVQPQLSSVLELIAVAGEDAFYRSAYAERLSALVQQRGGLVTPRDLAVYTPTWTRPLCTAWRGYTVLGAPPPMGGAAVLAMLGLADAAGVAAESLTGDGKTAATLADIMRIAQADGYEWRGDPAVMSVPARGMSAMPYVRARLADYTAATSGANVSRLADTVAPGDPRAADAEASDVAGHCAALDPWAPSPVTRAPDDSEQTPVDVPSYTSHLSVVDRNGNAVAMTTTVGLLFGSGVYADGVFLNSIGWNFDTRTAGPDRYANSTMAPTIVLSGDTARLVIGAAGSQYIQTATAQVIVRTLASTEDLAFALAGPRLQSDNRSADVEVEAGFAPAVYSALVARGFRPLSRVGDLQFGAVHAVAVLPGGRRIGAADPRRDGVAAGH